jgi:hypothetical protein
MKKVPKSIEKRRKARRLLVGHRRIGKPRPLRRGRN